MTLDLLWQQLEQMRKLCRNHKGGYPRRKTVTTFRNAMTMNAADLTPEAEATEEEIRSCLALDLTLEELREARQ